MKEQTTWSPTFTRVTPGPTASTMPAPSWPPTTGKRIIASPFWMWSSEWHSPAAMNLMRTSLGRGSSTSSSVISHGLPGSRQTAARVVMLIGAPSLDRTSAPVHGRLAGAPRPGPHPPSGTVAWTTGLPLGGRLLRTRSRPPHSVRPRFPGRGKRGSARRPALLILAAPRRDGSAPGGLAPGQEKGPRVIDKFRNDVLAVVDAVPSGASIAVGGFGSSGRPDALLDALCALDRRDLHVFVNNVGHDFTGVGRLLHEGRLRRVTCSFPILQDFYDEYFAGRVELELIPQGTLAERLRAGGAGIPAFFTPSGAGTMLADGTFTLRYSPEGGVAEHVPTKEHRTIGGREYVREEGIVADFGFVKPHSGDRKGTLRFRLSARNFNPLAGMSGRRTFAEVQHLVEVDELHPDDIHLPGVFVDEVVLTAGAPDDNQAEQVDEDTARQTIALQTTKAGAR